MSSYYKKNSLFIFLIAIFLLLSLNTQTVTGAREKTADLDYIMGPGDTLEISVWNNPELTKTMRIRPDGRISFPLVGEITANGKTSTELTEAMELALVKYIKEPRVSVIVTDYKSKNILVLGNIKKPGLYQYEGNMTILDAIGKAEGYDKFAKLRSVVVIRDSNSDAPQFYIADLYKAVHDGDTVDNITLLPKDIVYVPRSFIGTIDDFFEFFLSKIRPAAESYFFYNETDN